MPKALVVGINRYDHVSPLFGCVKDATDVAEVLARHADGTKNFETRLVVAAEADAAIERGDLKDRIVDLFSGVKDTALFYFAGHGHVEATGGYLVTSDARRGDDGLALGEIVDLANESPARNKIIILDSCHSGVAGARTGKSPIATLGTGLTILTASTAQQYATEEYASGIFTSLLVDALRGSAANLVGQITPGSVYAHIDQSLGEWDQRPVFKANVQEFVSLRSVEPPLPLADLQQITKLFPKPGHRFDLDPSFEPRPEGRTPEMPPPDPVNTERFAVLQKYNRVNLVVPMEAPHMWHAAMWSKWCRLTPLGEHYRRLRADDRF